MPGGRQSFCLPVRLPACPTAFPPASLAQLHNTLLRFAPLLLSTHPPARASAALGVPAPALGGSSSSIHNHGNVCAVIKVLHGRIEVDIHNKLETSGAAQVGVYTLATCSSKNSAVVELLLGTQLPAAPATPRLYHLVAQPPSVLQCRASAHLTPLPAEESFHPP